MGLTKQEIRDRLKVESTWVTTTRTALFDTVPEDRFRYVISIWIDGDMQATRVVTIEKLKEDGSYEVKWSHIPVAPADTKQIPEGSYDIEDPVISLEGGTRLYGTVDGNSINITVTYWDSEF